MKSKLAVGLAVFLCGAQASAKDIEIKTEQQKFSYAVGYQIAQSLKREGMAIDVDALSRAVSDVLAGRETAISAEEMQAAVQARRQQQEDERKAHAETAKHKGDEYLAANKSKPGVITTDSGLQYKVISSGDGAKPAPTDTVTVHYRGTLIDGKEFDSSHARGKPATFPVNGVIKGWQEVLPLMQTGSKWQVFIPSDLAYGARGAGQDIGPNEALIFEIELLSIKE